MFGAAAHERDLKLTYQMKPQRASSKESKDKHGREILSHSRSELKVLKAYVGLCSVFVLQVARPTTRRFCPTLASQHS